jgi:excinuclease UvrABC nuclease subunit
LYGIDTLLYIGQAKNLKNRISRHLGDKVNVIGRQANLSCRYACVKEYVKEEVKEQLLLDVVEQTLIVMYKPSFNSMGLKNVKSSVREKGYYIQNHGERGMLNFETTNYYWRTKSREKNDPG